MRFKVSKKLLPYSIRQMTDLMQAHTPKNMPKKIKRCEKCSRQFPKLEVVLIGNGTMTVEKEVAEEIWKLRRTIMAIELVIATNLDRK